MLPIPTLFSALYRLKRYHTAKAGDKVEYIGFKGLSCEQCDEETKRERGCHLPGYSYPSQVTWRVDYHDPVTDADRALFCPNSLLGLVPELLQIVDDALEIKEVGIAAYAKEAPADLDAWYNEAYRLVRDASARAQQEAEAAALTLSTQNKREQEAKSQWH